MKATALKSILHEVLQMDSDLEGVIRTNSGKEFTFNVGDNEDLILECVGVEGILQIFCLHGVPAWIDINEIEAICI